MGNPADVALLVDAADEPVRHTLSETMRREGWRVALAGQSAACAVVVWTERSIHSEVLAVSARPFLDLRRLLQLVLHQDSWNHERLAAIEPPEPFGYFQYLVRDRWELNGSERSTDFFGSGGRGEGVLAELACLGGLSRPRDRWNARIVFSKISYAPHFRFRKVLLVELAPGGGRILRRAHIDAPEPVEEYFETAIGNRWQVLDAKNGDVLDDIEIREKEAQVPLSFKRSPWWRGARGD
jgi:hypothetical protein